MTLFFFFQAEDGIRDLIVTGVQTCALPILVLAGSFVLPAHASITSDAYDPAWPEAIHCPAAIGDHALSSLFTVTGDDQQTKSLEVGDRFIDCKYGDVVRLT